MRDQRPAGKKHSRFFDEQGVLIRSGRFVMFEMNILVRRKDLLLHLMIHREEKMGDQMDAEESNVSLLENDISRNFKMASVSFAR